MRIRSLPLWPRDIPFVSVVIPCYNHGQFVEEAVQSVLGQTLKDLEIIIVNDGSTEAETNRILNGLDLPKTRVIHLPHNVGLPGARNAGTREARGKYICCLDADDKLQPTYLEKSIAMMESNGGISFVGAWVQVFGTESRVWYAGQFNPDEILYANQFGPPAVFRKTAWKQVGGFFEDMREGFEDWEYWVRLTAHGFRGYRIPEKLILYRRIGYSFAQRAAEKKDRLMRQIQANNPWVYSDPKTAILAIKRRYRDVYTFRPFANLARRAYHPPGEAQMIVSNLDSDATLKWLQLHPSAETLVWVAEQSLDEAATDALYEVTPFVYILPNFLPRYARAEAIEHIRRVWKPASFDIIEAPLPDQVRVQANSADH